METKEQRRFYDLARECANKQAAIFGLQRDDAEDCCQRFVVKCHLMKRDPPFWKWPPPDLKRFLLRSARNFALNFIAESRYWKHESYDTLGGDEVRVSFVNGMAETEYLPEAHLENHLFWDRIECGLNRITPHQREILVRVHVEHASMEEIASSCGASLHAIHERTSLARKRMRQAMTLQGDTRAELSEYVSHAAPAPLIIKTQFQERDAEIRNERHK